MATRTVGRVVAAGALAGPGVLGFAAPAGAAGGGDSVMIDNSPSVTIYTGQSLRLASVAKATCKVGLANRSVSLTLTGPTGLNPTTQTIKSDRVPCNRDASLASSIASPKLNGSYTVSLENSTPGNTTTAALDVLIPPSRAKGLVASTAGTVATFSWAANPEPDVVSYDILNAAGAVVISSTAADACSGGSSCSTSLDLGPSATGKTERFSIRAIRCGLTCSDSTVSGPSSASAKAVFSATPPPPAPSPTATSEPPSPTHGNSGGSGGGADGSGGSGGSGATTSGGGSSSASHGAGKAHLPSVNGGHLPSIQVPVLPGLQTLTKPLVLGKPGGKIQYPAPQVARTKQGQPRSTTQTISHDISSGLKLPPLWRGIAAAAILLLIAMHLRTWVARVELG